MKTWIAFLQILHKDVRTYYLKPPNISWGLLFPIAWSLMFYLRSDSPLAIRDLLPGVMALSVLFGTTSMLAVTITFERKGRSFDRLLLAPIRLEVMMLAKTFGAFLFGVINAFIPVLLALMLRADLAGIRWLPLALSVILLALTSTFLGLFIAVSAREVFEAQTFSNFFRFPMLFLCGLFIPVLELPLLLRPLSFLLPLTYGADILKEAIGGHGFMPMATSFAALLVFAALLFSLSLQNIRRKWMA